MSSSGTVTLQNQVMTCNSAMDKRHMHLFYLFLQIIFVCLLLICTQLIPLQLCAAGVIVAVSSSLKIRGMHCSSG